MDSPLSPLSSPTSPSSWQSPRSFFEKQPQKKDNIIIQAKIAKGKFPVYQAYCPAHNRTYALKAFSKDLMGSFQYQKEKLITKLNHPNVIRYIPIQCDSPHFYSLVTEFAPYGDFFEPVLRGIFDDEVIIRTYFHQLIEGLEYIHSQGVAHLDIKLENLMFGSDFRLKIIDFDQSQLIRDRSVTSGGSLCFRAPEIAKGICRDLAAADVYSAGVVLYTFRAREYPFLEMDVQNKKEVFYHYTFVKNNDVFWSMKSEIQGRKNVFSPDLIRLLNGMLEPVPERRFRLTDVKKSRWYNGPIVSFPTLEIEMRAKWGIVMKKRLL